jgi:predicted GIY-YIG superfamily endonuclease
MYYTYVLYSKKDDDFYTGFTQDLGEKTLVGVKRRSRYRGTLDPLNP